MGALRHRLPEPREEEPDRVALDPQGRRRRAPAQAGVPGRDHRVEPWQARRIPAEGRERADERGGRLHAGARRSRAACAGNACQDRRRAALLRGAGARRASPARPRAPPRAGPAGGRRRHPAQLPPAPRSRRADGAHDQCDDQAADAAGGREPREPDPRPSRSPRGSARSRAMIDYDPYSEEVIRDPYPIYARLREEAPCYHLPKWDAYALSRFEDIWNASMDAESYTAAQGTTASHLLTKVQPVTPMINLMDPPQHTVLRSRISRFFSPGTVAKLEPQIRGFVEEAWAPLASGQGADLFNDFAAKVSVKVACIANGFPLEDSDMLNRLVWRFFARQIGRTCRTRR